MRRIALLLTALASALIAALPGAAAAQGGQPLVPLDKGTPVREYAGVLLFSRWDGSAYRLSVVRLGRVADLPVRPQPTPFDADIGPDANGSPSAIVSLCDQSCDLYVMGTEPGDVARPVQNANTGADETDPSVWRGRLAFARTYGTKVVPYTKLLAAPRSRPSARLAALPAKRCGAVDPPDCRPIDDADLAAMELWGRWVAQSWTYQPDDFPGFRQNEIRLTDVGRTDTRQVAAMVTGLGGQAYLGPSFAVGQLGFFRACGGDPSGCSPATSGAFMYRISDEQYVLAGGNEAWESWALTRDGDLHVPSAFDCGGGDPAAEPTEACGIHARSGLRFEVIDAERVR